VIRVVPFFALFACDPADTGDTDTTEAHGAVVSTTDFSVGALASVDLDTFEVTDSLSATSSDPFVQFEDGRVYQVNGYGVDSISVYEPGEFDAPVAQFSTGTGTSPRTVALIDDQLFVTLYETDHVAVLDPADGTSLGTVDLAGYAGVDGVPEAATLVELGGKLYVALERLDRSDPMVWTDDGGRVAEIDPTTLTVTKTWEVGPSPQIYAHPSEAGKLIVRTGLSGQAVGGVRVLDPASATADAYHIDAAALGYGIAAWAGAPSGRGLVLAEHSDYSNTVECYDPEQGLATVYGPTYDWLTNPAIDADGRVWLPVRSFSGASGLVVIDSETCATLTAAPIGTILPPYKVAFY